MEKAVLGCGHLTAELLALQLKILAGTAAFAWVLWTVRAVDPRAVGMTITFPALNGIVLLTATDKIVGEMVIGIVPLMALNGTLPALYTALRRRLRRSWPAFALCLLAWAALASLLEWQPLWHHRAAIALVAAALLCAGAAWAFRHLRVSSAPYPAPIAPPSAWREFLRDRAPRIFWFLVSLAIVSGVAYALRDAHSLIGRLSALPLVPLFVLHWAVSARRTDLAEVHVAALLGPVTAGAFLIMFTISLGFLRPGAGDLHPAYWPLGIAALLLEWELTRRLILGLAALTYRARPV